MPDAVITVENLSKRYLIGHTTELEWNSTLREAVVHKVRGFARKAGSVVRGGERNEVVLGNVAFDERFSL